MKNDILRRTDKRRQRMMENDLIEFAEDVAYRFGYYGQLIE